MQRSNRFLDGLLEVDDIDCLQEFIEGLERLIRNDYQFTISNKSQLLMDEMREDDDNILSLLESTGYIGLEKGTHATSKDLYVAYCRWCNDNLDVQSILNIVENMKHDCIEKVVTDFCVEWYVSKDDVMYAAMHYRNGEIPNENAIKITADFASYKAAQERAIPKFKYYTKLLAELKKTLDEEIAPLISH